jgi:Undecaprenyl-phosphate glucose phosphotransferase
MSEYDPKIRFRGAAHLALASETVASFTALPPSDGKRPELSATAREVASHFSDRPISGSLLAGLVRLTDIFAITGIGLAMHTSMVADATVLDVWTLFGTGLGGLLLALFIQAFDGYHIPVFRQYAAQIGRVMAGWTMVFVVIGVVAVLIDAGAWDGRAWLAGWYLGGLLYLVLSRPVLTRLVRRWTADGRLERRAVVVGGGAAAESLITQLESQPENDIRICGIFDDRSDDRSPPLVRGYPKLGTIPELIEFGRICSFDMLIVTLPLTAESRVLQMLKQLWVLPVDIRLSAHTNKLKFRQRSYSYVGSVPFLDIFDKPLADWDAVSKRIFDLVIGTIALVILSPLMLATALAIKLDSRGPVFFRQKRHGFNNEIIDVWKFRSMYTDKTDAEVRKAVTKGDPRVTRVGRFIRKTSIDELPQLFNVLKGELSLVGPRPHAVNAQTENRAWGEVVDGYYARHKVKPGVTGWAQINGWRGEVDTPEKIRRRVEHDLYYIENWSLLLDLKILILTPISLFNTENAY